MYEQRQEAGLRTLSSGCYEEAAWQVLRSFVGGAKQVGLGATQEVGGQTWSLVWGLVQHRRGVWGEGENRLPGRGVRAAGLGVLPTVSSRNSSPGAAKGIWGTLWSYFC